MPPRKRYEISCFVPFFPPPDLLAPGPCIARVWHARGRVSAPARFARLIAPARETNAGHTSPSCFSVSFFAPARKEEANRPHGCRLPPPCSSYHGFPDVKPRWEKMPGQQGRAAPRPRRPEESGVFLNPASRYRRDQRGIDVAGRQSGGRRGFRCPSLSLPPPDLSAHSRRRRRYPTNGRSRRR